MNQASLLDWKQGNAAELERVSSRIAAAVMHFLEHGLGADRTFHMDDLTRWVRREVGEGAPDSAGRVLRSLRQAGRCGYSVVDRAKSSYRLTWVRS